MPLRSLPGKSRNGFDRDLLYTFVTHAGLLRDVIDTNSWRQNVRTNTTIDTDLDLDNSNNILYSSQREIKAVFRSRNEEHVSIILSH